MTEVSEDVPNPGSDAALDAGCTCAVLDNGHGRGYMGQPGTFVISDNCPLHGLDSGQKRFRPATPDNEPGDTNA